uniref:HAD-IB family hydrolase n=1 Tax=Dictyoglomus turgidum TaxID=513050 RepID=A0A7C3SNE7_9BACT
MKELVILDLDNVIIKDQSQKLLLKYLFKKKLIGFWYFLKIYLWFLFYRVGLVKSPKKVIEYAFRFLKDKKVEEIDKIADQFLNEILKHNIFKEVIDIIEKHKKEDRELIIISNVIDIIVKKVANFLNIKNYIGTRLEIINDKFTGKILGDIVYGENKTKYFNNFIKENNLSFDKIWSYGDHITDLDILKIASNPIAVNPDRFLEREAKKNNWQILNFKETLL